MKLNLHMESPGDERSGYVNIDASQSADIDGFVDDGEASEIVALDVLDYFPGPDVDDILNKWLKKLAHGGVLTLSVVDLREVSRAILAGSISLVDANELLFGKQEKDWQFKKSAFTLSQLAEVLETLGYKVLAKRVQNFRAVVTVQRN